MMNLVVAVILENFSDIAGDEKKLITGLHW